MDNDVADDPIMVLPDRDEAPHRNYAVQKNKGASGTHAKLFKTVGEEPL